MTDEQVLQQLQTGEQDALAALMDNYHRYVLTIVANVMGRAGTEADAEELVQDVFYALWSHVDDIRPGKTKAYLAVSARNAAVSFLRSRRELPMDLDEIDLPDDGDSLDDQLIQAERNQMLKKALHKMRPKDREIFLRYYYYMQTSEQIAETMHIPAGTVRSRLVRGRKILKKLLEDT